MQYKLAQIISTIINPVLLIALVPYMLIYKTTKSFNGALYWTEVSFVFIIIFSLFVLFGVWRGYFSNLNISNRKQRPLLYSFAILLSLAYLVTLVFLNAPAILYMGIIALALGLVIAEIINTKIKASLHVGTLVAFSTALVLIYGWAYLPFFILVPIVAWARIKTHNHTPLEIIVGGLTGFFLTLVVYVVFDHII